MSTTEIGRAAEEVAAAKAAERGLEILSRNWRNRWCEIDIVARSGTIIHFIEVKYRRNTNYGFAAEYISRDKAQRLKRAALAWNQAHGFNGQYQIDVITVEGSLGLPTVEYVPNAISD